MSGIAIGVSLPAAAWPGRARDGSPHSVAYRVHCSRGGPPTHPAALSARRFLLSCGRSPRGSEPRMKPRLKCDLDDLAFACEDANTEAANYLDLETGEVIRVSDEIRRELERLYEELDGVEDEDQSAFAAALR